LSQQADLILDRFSHLTAGAPDAAAHAALKGLLERIEKTLPPTRLTWHPSAIAVRPTQIPILGRTAAGILAPWDQFFAGHKDPDELGRLLEAVEGSAGRQRPGHLAAADPQNESQTAGDVTATLVQLSEPTADGIVEFVDLGSLGPQPAGTFALRVDGDSMMPRIQNGDLVVGRRNVPPEPGRTAIVQVRGQIGVTVKLWRPDGNDIHLVPVNEAYEPMRLQQDDVVWACRVLWVVRL